MDRDLFEYLALEARASFISDLRFMHPMGVALAVSRMSLDFPLSQWEDLYRYLLGEEPPKGANQRQLRALLVEKLPHADLGMKL